jgi:aminoglycoside phosphotransferase (APT) family kinase protein
MDSPTALQLKSLKAILASPALRRTDDKVLAETMGHTDTVLASLLARHIDMPGLVEAAGAAYSQLLPRLLQACAGKATGTAACGRLEAAIAAAPGDLEAMLPAVVDVLDALGDSTAPEVAQLCKQLVQIEYDYSRKLNAALRAARTPDPGVKAGAAHVKEYDEDALRHFIVAQYPEEGDIRIVKSRFLSGGHSKYTMVIELEGNRALASSLVLRADAGAGFGGSSVIEEYRLLKILHEHGAQVPTPIAIEPSGEVFGSPFLLVEFRPGRSIGHMYILPPPNLVALRDFATQLAKIHNIPLEFFGSATAGADMTIREQALAWIEQSYANWKALNTPGALMETSFRWLRDNVDLYDGRRTLVHGDFGLHNILVEDDKVSCVLDWEFAHIGNPVYDLGYFRFQAEALGPWEEFLRAYEAAGGIAPAPLQLDFANLFAETRMTVMGRQGEKAYYAGQPLGVPGAINVAAGYRNISDERIATLLNQVM